LPAPLVPGRAGEGLISLFAETISRAKARVFKQLVDPRRAGHQFDEVFPVPQF